MTERTHTCTVCHKSVSWKYLQVHMRTHTGERPYSCTKCNQTFTQSSHLTEHMRTHTGERRYQCTKCNKACTTSGSLTVHMRTHTGERPHSCTKCNQTFTTSGNLTVHMRTHTGVKPHPCTKCNQAFTLRQTEETRRSHAPNSTSTPAIRELGLRSHRAHRPDRELHQSHAARQAAVEFSVTGKLVPTTRSLKSNSNCSTTACSTL